MPEYIPADNRDLLGMFGERQHGLSSNPRLWSFIFHVAILSLAVA